MESLRSKICRKITEHFLSEHCTQLSRTHHSISLRKGVSLSDYCQGNRPSVRPSIRPPGSGPSHCPAASSDPSSNAYSASGLSRPSCVTRTSALARNVVLRPSGLHSPSSPFVRPLALERTMRSSSGSLPITSDTCYWLVPIKTSPSVGILILSSLRILPLGAYSRTLYLVP